MKYSEEKIKQYMIGGLTESQADEIDLQILSGEISDEALLIAENELIEDYLESNLPPAELVLFQKNFLTSKARKRQIQQISLLKTYAEQSEKTKMSENEVSENEGGFFWNLATLPSYMFLRAAFGVVIIGVFVGIFWFVLLKVNTNGNFSELEKEYAKINKADLSDIGKLKNLSEINLVSGNSRGSGKSNNLSEKSLNDKVLLRLALPNGVELAEGFRVEIKNEGKTVFTQIPERGYRNPNGGEIRFFMPSKILHKGDYQIIVKNPAADNSDLKYGFSIN